MLVVVAIIALLIAILLPSLKAARDQARAAQCGSNMHQVLTGIKVDQVEQASKKERISTNFGWAVPAFRVNARQGKIFTCPADTNPKPIPAMYVDNYDHGAYVGRESVDGVFNRVSQNGTPWGQGAPTGDVWYADIQNLVDAARFGFDSGNPTEKDLLLKYTAPRFVDSTAVTVVTYDSDPAVDMRGFDYKGRLLFQSAVTAAGFTANLPLLWLSYGANAPAGLKLTKGNPLLLVENSKQGAFPESYAPRGGQANDDLRKVLRFRHGGKASGGGLGDAADKLYEPQQKMNGGFLDGHVERLNWSQMVLPPNANQVDGSGNCLWFRSLWIGIRSSTGELSF